MASRLGMLCLTRRREAVSFTARHLYTCFQISSPGAPQKVHDVRPVGLLSVIPKGVSFIHPPRRHLWGMLNSVFNRPDYNRIREVGAQRACAEWLLRCGAYVRWQQFEKFVMDYNQLPPSNFASFKIEEIDADNAAIMAIGFPHFEGVDTVKKIRFHFCAYFRDDAMLELTRLKDSLEHLEVSSCGDVTERGLSAITQLTKLKTLVLYDIPEVRDKEKMFQTLQSALPNCQIDYKDLQNERNQLN